MRTSSVLLIAFLFSILFFPQAGRAQVPADPAMFRSNPQHTGVYPDSKIPAGKLKWSFDTGNKVRSAPALSGGTLYIGSNDGYLYALDAQTGKLKWKYQAAGAVASSPAVYRDTIFFEAGDAAMRWTRVPVAKGGR